MKKDVLVTFSSNNAYHEIDDKDSVVFQTRGTLYDKDGKFYLNYNEEIENSKVKNTLKIEDRKVTIMRFGDVNTQKTIEQGKKHLNYYETPEGTFLMGVLGDKVNVSLDDKKGRILLKYGVEFNNVLTTLNTIDVKYEEI